MGTITLESIETIAQDTPEYIWADKPSVTEYGKGQLWFSDISAMGYSNGEVWSSNGNQLSRFVDVSSERTAAQNTAAIQAALDVGGKVIVRGDGNVLINDTLVLSDNTHFVVDKGLTLKMDAGTHKHMLATSGIINKSTTGSTVTIAWTQGLRATVTWTGHGKAVGDYIWFDGADQAQYNGVFLIYSVTNADTFVVMLDRTPLVTATGTIKARVPNENITVEVNGIFDYDRTTKSGGLPFDLLCVVLSGVNLNILRITVNNASKYCLCVGAVRHTKLANIHCDITNSDVLKVYGPAYDVTIDTVTGMSKDDFISLQGLEPPAYADYMWSSGDVINIKLKNIRPATSTASATLTLYASDSGQIIDNVVIDNIDIVNRIAIMSNEGGTAGVVGNVTVKNAKAPDDSLWASGGISVKLTGTVEGLTLQDTYGNYWPKEFITVASTATVKKLTVKNCGLKAGANHIVNNAGIINKLLIHDNNLDNATSATYLRLVKNSKTIHLCDIFHNRCAKLTAAIEQAAGVTAGGIIKVRDNYLSGLYGVFELIENSEVVFSGNVGDVFTGKYILNINGSGKSVKVTTRDNTITYGSSAIFIKRTVGNELVAVFGIDLPVALNILNRAIPGQMVKAAAAIGTVLINEICVNDTTNTAGSWHQISNPALVY